jgi:hypothetical protein
MTENEALDRLAILHKRLDACEDENQQLRTANAMLQDEIRVLKRKAEVGEATARFFKEIKQIVME